MCRNTKALDNVLLRCVNCAIFLIIICDSKWGLNNNYHVLMITVQPDKMLSISLTFESHLRAGVEKKVNLKVEEFCDVRNWSLRRSAVSISECLMVRKVIFKCLLKLKDWGKDGVHLRWNMHALVLIAFYLLSRRHGRSSESSFGKKHSWSHQVSKTYPCLHHNLLHQDQNFNSNWCRKVTNDFMSVK